MILDTNIILYQLQGRLSEKLPESEIGISIITYVELLAYPNLGTNEREVIREFLEDVQIWMVDKETAEAAILIRSQYALKVPDALIAATALVAQQELLTNDNSFLKIEHLQCRSLKLMP